MDGPSTPSAASSSGLLTPPPETPATSSDRRQRRRSSTGSRERSGSFSGRPLDQSVRSPSPKNRLEANALLSGGYVYPAAAEDIAKLSADVQDFKLARFLRCRTEGCECEGLRPPEGAVIRIQVVKGKGKEKETDSKTVLWDTCGQCSHGWRLDDEPDGGHTLSEDISEAEQQRRRRVDGRMEEIYNVSSTGATDR